MTNRVVGVAHDAGGARAIIPVLEELARRGVATQAYVAGPAASLWPAECIAVRADHVPDAVSFAEATAKLTEPAAEMLLSASGLYNSIEHTFRRAARASRIRTVAVLDSWLNYAERFRRAEGTENVASLPDVLCVIDETSRRGAVEAGLDPGRVVVCGAPNLERSVRQSRDAWERRATLRRNAGIPDDRRVLVFFSEPFVTGPDGARFEGAGALFRADGEPLYGYTSESILDAVLDDLDAQNHEAGRCCHVVIKAHPAEWSPPLRAVAAKHASDWTCPEVRDDGPAATWIGMADGVVGMMSVALLEAALAGRPTLSVQIGLRESGAADPCLAAMLGYTPAVYHRSMLAPALRRLMAAEPWPRGSAVGMPIAVDGAAARVADIVLGDRRCA